MGFCFEMIYVLSLTIRRPGLGLWREVFLLL